MNAATERLAKSSVAATTAAQLQAYHPDVPPEKLSVMWARFALGGCAAGLGLLVLTGLVFVPVVLAALARDAAKIPLLLIFAGLAAGLPLFAWGMLIVSSQLVARPMATAVATFKGVWQTIRGKNGNGAPPA